MKTTSPLGKWAAGFTAVIFLLVILAALWGHTIGKPDSMIDAMALVVFGIVTGTAGSLTILNGTVKRTAEQDDEIASLRAEVRALRDKP